MNEIIKIFILSCLGGTLFYWLHLPLPWMLGPLATTLLMKSIHKTPAVWPRPIRNAGLIVLGFTMGSSFTLEIGRQIALQLPGMIAATCVTLIVSLFIGWLASRQTGVGLTNGMLGSIPGGLTQMVVLCEEIEGANVSIVTLMQTIRMLTVVFLVPLFATYGLAGHSPIVTSFFEIPFINVPSYFEFAIGAVASAELGKLIKLPSPYLIGPMLATIVLILCGLTAPQLPRFVVAIAQVTVGIRMGLDIKIGDVANWKQIAMHSLWGILVVLVVSIATDFALVYYYSIPFLTAFISTAPGGMTEMGLTAISLQADVSIVVAYQLFRLLTILLLAIPAVKWWITHYLQPHMIK